jgi:iron complex outermembrane receptor protein
MKLLLRRKFVSGAALFALAGLLRTAHAQTSPAAASGSETNDQTQVLDKFVVTGSYIPTAADSPVAPVSLITPLQIENSGDATNLLEVIRKTSPQFVGNGNLGATNANIGSSSTNGGAQISLLNTQTLVLIDGRRAAFSPVAGLGGYQFVDLNLIPVGAVERVEVVKDGASAIYGSDAIAGVVNIILKKDYQGFEADGRIAFATQKGHYRERSFDIVAGSGTPDTHVTVSAEWFKADPLYQRDRSFSSPIYGTPTFPGVVQFGSDFYLLKSGLNTPPAGPQSLAQLVAAGVYTGPYGFGGATGSQIGDIQKFFDLSSKVTLLEGNQRKSATIALDHKLSSSFTIFADALISKTDTFSQLNAQPFNANVEAGVNGNPFDAKVKARNRLVDYPRQFFTDTVSNRGTVGIRGTLAEGWTAEAAVTYNEVSQNYRNPNLVDTAARQAAVANGTINLFAISQAAGAVEASGMLGTAFGEFDSRLWTADAHVTGRVAQLPAGPVEVAVGAEYRKESLSATSDRNSQTASFAWDSATTLDPFDKARHVDSVFGEVRVPLTSPEQAIVGLHSVSLDGAVRYERYSDAGATTVPKISVRYLPVNDDFALRATYSKAFTAPSLYSLYGPGGVGFTPGLNLNAFGGGTAQNVQGNLQLTNNPDLKPSKADDFTVGVVYSPKAVQGLSLSADYFYIMQRDLVGGVDYQILSQDVENKGPASPYAKFVALDDYPGTSDSTPITAPGQLVTNIDNVYISSSSLNASQVLRGINLEGDYSKALGGGSRLDLTVQGLYLQSFKYKFGEGLPWVETVGQATNVNGTMPRFHSYTTASYTWDDITAFVGWTYYPGVKDPAFLSADGNSFEPRKTSSYHSFDVSLSYKLSHLWRVKNAKLTIGANNVFNKAPPLSPSFTESNVDIATYGPVGRLLYVTLGVKF